MLPHIPSPYVHMPPWQKQGRWGILRSGQHKRPSALFLLGQRASAVVKLGFNVQTATQLFLIVQNVSLFKHINLHLVPITGPFLHLVHG